MSAGYKYDRCRHTLDWRQCILEEGHPGRHRNASGQEWRPQPMEHVADRAFDYTMEDVLKPGEKP